jgi:aminoglycoside N3'-acetyltransferase
VAVPTSRCSDMAVTIDDVRSGVRALDLSGRPACVHSSLRSFGLVEGGAATILQGLLAEGCTVMVPTFSFYSRYQVPAPPNRRWARNGTDYGSPAEPTSDTIEVYTPADTSVDKNMGAIAAAAVAMTGHVRGNHPLDSFTAVGPLASELIPGQAPLDVYAPLKALVEKNGLILLMGVGLTRMTLIHYAEQRAGRKMFRRWAKGRGGQVIEVEVGGDSDGFGNLGPSLRPLMKAARVGKSLWRALGAREGVAAATQAIRQYPAITRCSRGCRECDDAVAGGPLVGTVLPVGPTGLDAGDSDKSQKGEPWK